jgi:hypothetical protein
MNTAIDCHFIRFIQRDSCVIRVKSSGSLVQVLLDTPLDLTKACMVSALKPVSAKICLGEYKEGVFHNCTLEVMWPELHMCYPNLKRFTKKAKINAQTSTE